MSYWIHEGSYNRTEPSEKFFNIWFVVLRWSLNENQNWGNYSHHSISNSQTDISALETHTDINLCIDIRVLALVLNLNIELMGQPSLRRFTTHWKFLLSLSNSCIFPLADALNIQKNRRQCVKSQLILAHSLTGAILFKSLEQKKKIASFYLDLLLEPVVI